MKAGTQLVIDRTTIALDHIGEKRTMIMVPMDSTLTVLPGLAEGDTMVNVLWESRVVEMFAVDLAMRGNERRGQAAAA